MEFQLFSSKVNIRCSCHWFRCLAYSYWRSGLLTYVNQSRYGCIYTWLHTFILVQCVMKYAGHARPGNSGTQYSSHTRYKSDCGIKQSCMHPSMGKLDDKCCYSMLQHSLHNVFYVNTSEVLVFWWSALKQWQELHKVFKNRIHVGALKDLSEGH